MRITTLLCISSLLISYNIHASDAKSLGDFLYEFFFGKSNADKKPTINYQVLEVTVGMIIDTVLGADEQPKEIRADIVKYKEIMVPIIIKQLKSKYSKDYYEAVTHARELTYTALARHIGQRAAKYADELLKEQSLMQETNATSIKEKIKQEFIDKAIEQKKDTYCSLCSLYGEQLRISVEKRIKEHKQPSSIEGDCDISK